MATGCGSKRMSDGCTMLYGNHTSHHEVVFLRWFWWYRSRYIHDTCCHSSPLEVFVCVCPSPATLVNPNIYRTTQIAKQCKSKLPVPSLKCLNYKKTLGWHFALSLVGTETPGHLQVTSSFHTTADAAAQAGSVALLILVQHQHDSSNLVSQRHRIVSFAGHMSTSVSHKSGYCVDPPLFLATIQGHKITWPWQEWPKCFQAQNAEVSSCSSEGSVTIPDLNVLSLCGWQFRVMMWVPPLRHVNSCFSKMIVGIFDFQSRSICVSGKICCR